MKKNFLKSKSYQNRIIYIEFGILCILNFSRAFNQKHEIIVDCLDASKDKVSNVRRKAASYLFEIREIISEDDKNIIAYFEDVCNQLLIDSDVDVKTVRLLNFFFCKYILKKNKNIYVICVSLHKNLRSK